MVGQALSGCWAPLGLGLVEARATVSLVLYTLVTCDRSDGEREPPGGLDKNKNANGVNAGRTRDKRELPPQKNSQEILACTRLDRLLWTRLRASPLAIQVGSVPRGDARDMPFSLSTADPPPVQDLRNAKFGPAPGSSSRLWSLGRQVVFACGVSHRSLLGQVLLLPLMIDPE